GRLALLAAGGRFQEVIPTWMMHAYVDPEHDAQGGVFAMFNPSIWPIADSPADIERLRAAELSGAVNAPINNFSFGDVTAEAGEPIVFSNSDSVPHTVTAGSPGAPLAAFDSGLLGTGERYDLSFDEPGEYDLFCAIHPGMRGSITVE
ncbi:MAG: plastocyanin/azurin family copper-binding protein, partial [Actinomycetota bacterium]